MTDVHTTEVRSFNMSQIRSKNTIPELTLRKALFARGFRFRIHQKKLPGKPDLVLRKYQSVIMVHGCFWHGHKTCKNFVVPKTRTAWWTEKINRNRSLDKKNGKALRKMGWNVIVIYECELKKQKLNRTIEKTIQKLKSISHD